MKIIDQGGDALRPGIASVNATFSATATPADVDGYSYGLGTTACTALE